MQNYKACSSSQHIYLNKIMGTPNLLKNMPLANYRFMLNFQRADKQIDCCRSWMTFSHLIFAYAVTIFNSISNYLKNYLRQTLMQRTHTHTHIGSVENGIVFKLRVYYSTPFLCVRMCWCRVGIYSFV